MVSDNTIDDDLEIEISDEKGHHKLKGSRCRSLSYDMH